MTKGTTQPTPNTCDEAAVEKAVLALVRLFAVQAVVEGSAALQEDRHNEQTDHQDGL